MTVGFNATGLFGGTYNGAVHLTTNDPLLPTLDVPSILHVIGVPDIAVNPMTLDFGERLPRLLADPRADRDRNIGTDDLVMTNIASSNPAFDVDVTSFTVTPLGGALVQVSYLPAAGVGTHTGTLTITSNDPDMPDRRRRA